MSGGRALSLHSMSLLQITSLLHLLPYWLLSARGERLIMRVNSIILDQRNLGHMSQTPDLTNHVADRIILPWAWAGHILVSLVISFPVKILILQMLCFVISKQNLNYLVTASDSSLVMVFCFFLKNKQKPWPRDKATLPLLSTSGNTHLDDQLSE